MNKGPGPILQLKKLAFLLARPAIPFFTLPALGLILVAGTISQRYIGLYESQKIFFSSLPSLAVLGFLTLSLACKFLFFSPWSLRRVGINLSHLGILVLLGGGFMTALQAQEGHMVIGEKETSSLIRDYHDRSLIIAGADGQMLSVPFITLRAGQVINIPGTGAEMKILEKCRACSIIRQDAPPEGAQGMARGMRLVPGRPAENDEQTIVGITFLVSGAGPDIDGQHVLFDPAVKPLEIQGQQGKISVVMSKTPRALPFRIRLDDFHAEQHPGTAMARSYRSDVTVIDGNTSWESRIEMNKPLRYKGYTFFQSSFVENTDGTQQTVLAVVHNTSWLFPYIGTLLMGLGLLAHMVIRLRRMWT